MISAAKPVEPEPTYIVKNPNAEISDQLIDSLTDLLLESLEREDQES